MIPLLSGWSWAYVEDSFVMTSDRGVITYRERCRPLRSLRAILAGVSTELGAPERIVTLEGEYAAFSSDSASGVCVGVVFGDDFYSLFVGRGAVAEIVRDLVVRDVHSLGVRRRRFWFEPPPAEWSGIAMLFHAVYLNPGYPRAHGMLSVLPAIPRPLGEARADWVVAIHDLPMLQFHRDTSRETSPITSASGLAGAMHELRGTSGDTTALRFVAVLEDATYLYPVTLDTTDARRDSDVAVLNGVVSSIVALPSRGQARVGTAAVSHFTD